MILIGFLAWKMAWRISEEPVLSTDFSIQRERTKVYRRGEKINFYRRSVGAVIPKAIRRI